MEVRIRVALRCMRIGQRQLRVAVEVMMAVFVHQL